MTVDQVRAHPAVAEAAAEGSVVHVVPDPVAAPLLHRACGIDLPDGLAWHEPAPDLLAAGVNRSETHFLHREVWLENAYLRHGLGLPERPVVVDIGANIGLFSLLAGIYAPGARIIAAEPMPGPAAAVAVNGRLHDLDLTVVTEAVGDRPGTADLTYYPGNTVMSGRYADAAQDQETLRSYLSTDPEAVGLDLDRLVGDRLRPVSRTVPVTTVGELVARFGLTDVDLLKIDVEKAELEVLDGIDARLWPRIQQVAVEVHDLAGRLEDVLDRLRAQGFLVAHERDPRMTGTALHTVYARRPGGRPVRTGPPAPHPWPTARALAADLRERSGSDWPEKVVLTRVLPEVRHPEEQRQTPETITLAQIWDEVLGPGAATSNADFFELGGTSLAAVRLIDLVDARLGEGTLEPDAVFTAASFSELAAIAARNTA